MMENNKIEAQKSVLDLLLGLEAAQPARKSVRMKRLSELAGADVVLELRALTFAETLELKRGEEDLGTAIMMAGVASPDLRNRALMERHKASTPEEMVKKLFLPGEIEDVSREIERLSGYRTEVLEEFQKN